METKDITLIQTDCSPSHISNNISTSDKNIIFIHNSEIQPRVIIIDKKLLNDKVYDNLPKYITKLNSSDASEFTRIKYLNVHNMYYIGVGLIGGFQLWSNDASRLIFHIPCKNKNSDKLYCFNAISECKSNEKSNGFDSIVSADNYGNIHLIVGSNQTWKSRVIYTYENQTATDIKCDENNDIIACAYETGEIHILKFKGEGVELKAKFDNTFNLPALSLGILSSPKLLLLAGYANGEVKIFSLEKNYDLVGSLGSHLRMINALCVLGKSNVFATAGDDCFVNIFRVENDLSMSMIGNYDIQHKPAVGVALVNDKDRYVDCIVTTYDNPHLIYLEKCFTI
jgi:hypothetical protein